MKHLLVDDHAVQTTFNLRRRFHEPVKHPEPVLAPERPWEGNNFTICQKDGTQVLHAPPIRDRVLRHDP